MENKRLVVSLLFALLSVPTLGAQTPTVGTINRAEVARQAGLPQGAAPQGLVATALSPTSVRLSWAAAAGATGYLVYRETSANGSTPPIATVPPPSAEMPTAAPRQRMLQVAASTAVTPVGYLDAGVMPHSTVYYRVAATYEAQKTGASEMVSATTPIAPQPTGLFAISGPSSVTLSWHPAPGATSYSVTRTNYIFTNSCSSALTKNLLRVRDTTYTDARVPPCTFVYRVIAYYTVQGQGEVEGDLGQVPAVTATPRPPAPTDLRVDRYYGGTVVDLRWNNVADVTSYTVLRALASDGNFAEVPGLQFRGLGCSSSPGWCDEARDNTAQIGETYLYKLVAYSWSSPPSGQKVERVAGESNVARITVKPKLPGIRDLTASSPQAQTVELHWTPPPGAQGYVILRSSPPLEERVAIGPSEPPLNLTGNVSSYRDTYLLKGRTYQYYVVTWYGGDNWGEEASAEAKTP
jgi:hypothetical protein